MSHDRSILITGCSSGIGHDAAHGLKARGWRVFATCRQQADCDRLQAEGLESFRLDLADEGSVAGAVDEALTNASLAPAQIDRVFLTGGSSFVPAVRRLFVDRFGEDKIDSGAELESIASGLALMGGENDLSQWCERAG